MTFLSCYHVVYVYWMMLMRVKLSPSSSVQLESRLYTQKQTLLLMITKYPGPQWPGTGQSSGN